MSSVSVGSVGLAGGRARVARDPSQAAVALIGAVSVVVFIAGIAAVVNDDGAVPAAGARIQLDGSAVRIEADGNRVTLSDGSILHPGDRVDVVEGTATFELADGGSVEGRSGRNGADDTSLTIGAPVELLAGDALAVGPSGVTVEAAGTTFTLDPAEGDGAARIRRDLAVTAATYVGNTVVDSVGQERDVPALRQLGVSSVGRPAAELDPLRYEPSDPWDLRYLAGAIDATRQLDSLARSFTARAVTEDFTSAAAYEAVVPELAQEPAFDASFIDAERPAGETLVGAVIAVLGGQGDFAERWDEVFEFRNDRAAWGLVVLDQDVTEDAVLDHVTAALERSFGAAPEVAGADTGAVDGAVVENPDAGAGSGGSSTTVPPSPTTTVPPEAEEPTTPSTLLPGIPPIDIPLLPPITLPTLPLPLPPLDGTPITDSGGLLNALLTPVGDLLASLIGPGSLLDAG